MAPRRRAEDNEQDATPPRSFDLSIKASTVVMLGSALAVVLSVAAFVVTTQALPGRVARLEEVAQNLAMANLTKDKVDALQDERQVNMLDLLSDIKEELKAIRQQGRER